MDEAISAVADEGFLGDEDDDYEDLYNDVNVGENFMQSMRKTDDPGFRNDVVEEKRTEQPPMVPGVPPSGSAGFSAPGVVDGAANTGGAGGPADPRALPFQNQGFRGNEVKAQGPVGSSPLMGGGSGGMRVELAQRPSKPNEIEERTLNNNSVPGGPQGLGQQVNGSGLSAVGNIGNDGLATQGAVRNMSAIGVNGAQIAGGNSSTVAVAGPGVGGNFGGSGGGGTGGGGSTMLFVGDLHWWTTDGDLEAELCKYGQVKEVKFFDEKASGKSKGYCQVEFFDASAATACKEGMNGHLFNGRACVVAFATPFTIKRMGEAQVNRSQPATQSTGPQARRGPNDMVAKTGGNNMAAGGDFQGGENRGFGRGNWGRGNMQGMGNRGAVGGPMRNRGGMGGRGLMGNGGHGFGQGMAGGPPMMHPQAMMGQGFDPAFGGHMGRMGGYGGFPGAPGPPFGGLMPSFPPGGVGLPGVAPHVNPAIFGRGMPMNGMGMMPTAGMEGPNMGMWSDPSMGGWGGEEPGGRAAESSYGEEAASEHQYPEANQDRGAWQNSSKEKERGSERDWSGSSDRRYPDDRDVTREKDTNHDREWSERRHRDERDSGRERSRDHERERERSRDRERDRERERDRDRDRERYREDREKHSGHYRHRDHESEHADDYERGRSSRTHSKSRVSQEDDHRSRSRDADYGKRRRES